MLTSQRGIAQQDEHRRLAKPAGLRSCTLDLHAQEASKAVQACCQLLLISSV